MKNKLPSPALASRPARWRVAEITAQVGTIVADGAPERPLAYVFLREDAQRAEDLRTLALMASAPALLIAVEALMGLAAVDGARLEALCERLQLLPLSIDARGRAAVLRGAARAVAQAQGTPV